MTYLINPLSARVHMAYSLFEIPSIHGKSSDIVIADRDSPGSPAYSHYAFTVPSPPNPNELMQRRGIPLSSLRDWDKLSPDKIFSSSYVPGSSLLGDGDLNQESQAKTVMRLGALELLANISSGRITIGDKDPFPHQLALKQHMKANQQRIQRLLIADEVGLGKTIEVGLLLRDLIIEQGPLNPVKCLYLTKGGLLDDVRLKLQSVVPSPDIVQVKKSFIEYGSSLIDGIHIASMDAARRYVRKARKKNLPQKRVAPDILIIDEAHHCASEDDLTSTQRISLKSTTRAYEAAYQMISGEFWEDSAPPKLVILMSATPFRSKPQFINLLRLITHKTQEFENAYSSEIDGEKLVNSLGSSNSSSAIVWRQQDDVRSWSDNRLFPNLTIKRPALIASEAYLSIIKEIRDKVIEVHKNNEENFGGFAIRQLEIKLTSSTISGAMWLFRWCVKHQSWKNQEEYKQDTSQGTENLRKLIKGISKKLADYDEQNKSGHVTVYFPNIFTFEAKSLAQPLPTNKLIDIYKFNGKLRNEENDEDGPFIADADEITELTELALKLLNFTDVYSQDELGAENVKLNWLKEALENHPKSNFLVFTESLQTCEIITKALPQISAKLTGDMSLSQRDAVVAKLSEDKNPVRVLVATSAADEGFDFQVANHVVHWDLSPNPAVLMQRNGRVARLGQISDVTAYYLIITGTHEEKRDHALVERFKSLGIKDEKMRLKILGSLNPDLEDIIFVNIESNDFSLIDDILKKAESDQKDMEQKLSELQTQINQTWVISRNELSQRLERWIEMGLPNIAPKYEVKFSFKEWNRPVFKPEGTVIEVDQAKIAIIHNRKFTFDPEFKVFGKDKDNISLAGLCPWHRQEDYNGVIKHKPLSSSTDLIGELLRSLARQRKADFITISSSRLSKFPHLQSAQYLLFATHPFSSLEEDQSSLISGSDLTVYAFNSNFSQPMNSQGMLPKDVYEIISMLEEDVMNLASPHPTEAAMTQARNAGKMIADWLNNSRKMGGFSSKKYFLPVPVALVAVLPNESTGDSYINSSLGWQSF